MFLSPSMYPSTPQKILYHTGSNNNVNMDMLNIPSLPWLRADKLQDSQIIICADGQGRRIKYYSRNKVGMHKTTRVRMVFWDGTEWVGKGSTEFRLCVVQPPG